MSAPVYEFGEFRLDCGRFELRRDDESLKLERKPLDLLILLVSRQGLLVTRAEISQKLWDSEIFVDRELGINTAVRKIRAVLGDDPDNPRFVQTVTGMGYRFIAAVRTEGLVSGLETAGPVSQPGELSAVPVVDAHWRRGLLALAAVGATLAIGIWFMVRPRSFLAVTDYVQLTRSGGAKYLIGTDGSNVYFDEAFSNLPQVGEVSVNGGEPAVMQLPLSAATLIDMAEQSSTFLLGTVSDDQWHLWSFQLPGGPLRSISSSQILNTANDSAWSPDERSIAVITQEGDVYRMRSDGSDLRRLSTGGNGGVGLAVVWSPDGRHLRFLRNRKLWEIGADGSALHPVIEGAQEQCGGGRWTADRRYFIFVACDDRTPPYLPMGQLWALDERHLAFGLRRKPMRLTTGPMQWSTPMPSRDGRSVFARGVILRGQLVRYNAGLREFQPALDGISAEFVTWSRDGRFVAYVTFPDGILWRADADGSHRVQLTSGPLYPVSPRWSPDGSQIAFSDVEPSSSERGYLISASGGEPRRLSDDPGGDQREPVWSPDGRELMYATGGEAHREKNELRILNLETRRTRTVTGSTGIWSPRWSPDGRYVAGLTPEQTLRLFDFQTQRWSPVSQGMCEYPMWSSDGRYLYFVKNAGDEGIYRVRVPSGDPELVVDLKGFQSTGLVGLWVGLDHDDVPILLRDTGSDEIYALRLAGG